MDVSIRVAGEAGQGVQTTGNLLVGALAGMGLHVVATQSYMSRVRGGLNWYDVRVGDSELFSGTEKADLLVALTDVARRTLREDVADGGLVLFDGDDADGATCLPFTRTAKDIAGSALMANTVAAGAVYAILGYDVDGLCEYLGKLFGKKGREVIEKNVACARRGAELAAAAGCSLPAPAPTDAPATFYDGAYAIALGAATAGLKVAAAYPMTPGTATFAHLAALAEEYSMAVEQVEDEIAVMNLICGAAYAGAPAMTSTSGGGFALMVEGMSLAGILELPVLVVLAQRPGPATGLPTRTAQQDLRFALHGGHGEFVRAVFAPRTQGECYDIARRALAQAHRHQTPVLLLTDQFLQDMQKNIPALSTRLEPIDHCLVAAGADYARYAVTDSGVSPRAIPGGEGFVVVDSDEHDADGHLTENLDVHLVQQDKRMRKAGGLLSDAMGPERYGPADAEALLICWGSTYGPCREAVDRLAAAGRSVAMLSFAQVWPLRAEEVRQAIGDAKRVICVEGNQTGQFASALREIIAIGDCERIARYDGMPFTPEYIVREVTS